MNTHMSQSIQTMMELKDFASVAFHMLTPKDGKPIITPIQDSLLGTYRMTKDHTRIDDKVFANLQMVNGFFQGTLPDPSDTENNKYTGQQAYSQILPPGLFAETKNGQDGKVSIQNSQLTGTIDKKVYNSHSIGLLHSIYKDYGPTVARRFMDNISRTISRWLLTSGFSVGISDLVITGDIEQKLQESIEDMKKKVFETLQNVRNGKFQNHSIYSNAEYFEAEVNKQLNAVIKTAGGLVRENMKDTTNRMINMIKAGSKGNEMNVSQMVICVGQQNVDGKRITYGFTDRTLPHYTKFDDGPDARGFVENSFLTGLTPQQVFFHAMGGREGLIDTAVKSVTGDTPIVILEDGKPRYLNIGDWIDANLEAHKTHVEHFEERQMELLQVENEVYIPTMDENGTVTWGKVTAMTRHDPGTELYEIKTAGGKSVIVTESKSLLIWHEDRKEFKEVPTPTIKVGDYVPTTANLVTPPVLLHSIDMTTYFPKNKYVHGTDFHKAIEMMNESMQGRRQIPPGWWSIHNGSSFELPYPNKARLQRVTVRSNTENIKEGCIYPFHASREHGHIPDTFVLNEENGIFIGLFLSEGHASINTGTVTITNSNPSVREFVKSWFRKLGIAMKEVEEENHIGGVTTSIIGYSRLLAQFLTAWVGHTSYHKYVPSEAFVANEEFVKGVLNGYFSGDGTITSSSIESSSASARLTEGISMLCTRIGVFGKVFVTQTKTNNLGTEKIAPAHRLAIRSHWARKFASIVPILEDVKAEQIKSLRCTKTHKNFMVQNDVVLDEIVEINIIDVAKYPKVYDLTIPSTLNFGLANGLQVRDTSDTGYTQRKLVKAMEDCRIHYDYTVRNATGSIIQFLYGEDGMEGTKIESQPIPYLWEGMTDEKLQSEYLIDKSPESLLIEYMEKEAYEKMIKVDGWLDQCKSHFQELLSDRAFLIEQLFKKDYQTSIQYPIPFKRIINKSTAVHGAKVAEGQKTDLTATYVLSVIKKLVEELQVAQPTQGTRFAQILIRLYLSPKPLIKAGLTKKGFDAVVEEIRRHFKEAIAPPGEMVGVIAAQSIGEPATQLTLNTFHLAGISDGARVTRGVPRLKELLNVTKVIKAPSLTIRLKEEIAGLKESAQEVMRSLEITRLRDLVSKSEIMYDPPGADGYDTGVPEDMGFLNVYRRFAAIQEEDARQRSPWVLRLQLSHEKLLQHNMTMLDVFNEINKSYNDRAECLFTDDNAKDLIFRIRLEKSDDIDPNDYVTALKALENNLLQNMVLKGITGIKKVMMREAKSKVYDDVTAQYPVKTEYVLETDGTNLMDILAHPNIDNAKTISNDVVEIFHTLGIEAARNALYYEINEVIKESSVNYRHISLLIDTMTNRGTLMSIDRHGINRGDVGPLAKSSFEESTEMLINAGLFGEMDPINGVSANIMLGQLAPCGSSVADIILDEDLHMQLLAQKELRDSTPEHESVVANDDDAQVATNCAIPASGTYTYKLPKAMDTKINLPAIPKVKLVA